MAETPLGRDLHDAVGSLVALARAGGDPAEVEASLLEVQSLFQGLITGIHVALAAIADRGNAVALEYAEMVESPATRGAVLISIWFDPADEGNLRRRISYERASE